MNKAANFPCIKSCDPAIVFPLATLNKGKGKKNIILMVDWCNCIMYTHVWNFSQVDLCI